MQRICSFLAAFLLLANIAAAQNLPISNIFLLETEWRDSILLFKNPQFLTGFNKLGYNNQPAFISNDELLITVGMNNESQTDIYLLDLKRKEKLRLTKTAESEYSPKPTLDNLFFSVVRVETDADRSQRLWQYPLDRKDAGRPVFRYLRGIGYYHWLDRFKVALFNVATTNYLSVGDTRDESTQHLSPNVGRCFQTSPNGRLVFVHKVTDDRWVIKALDKNTLDVQEIAPTVPGAEDFVIMDNGYILMGKGSRLFTLHPLKNTGWQEVVDLKSIGIYNVSRMALSKDGKLAVVTGFE
jgi:hypothetical protein